MLVERWGKPGTIQSKSRKDTQKGDLPPMNLRAGDLNTFISFESINPETPATSQGVSAAEYTHMHPSLPHATPPWEALWSLYSVYLCGPWARWERHSDDSIWAEEEDKLCGTLPAYTTQVHPLALLLVE